MGSNSWQIGELTKQSWLTENCRKQRLYRASVDRYAGTAEKEVTLDAIPQGSLDSSDLEDATDRDEPETLPQGLDSSSTSPLQETLLSLLAAGKVAGVPTKMLIDTGSALTLVREDIWNWASTYSRLSIPDSLVVAANWAELDVGKTSILLEVGNLRAEFPALVAKTLTQQCILGVDFLWHNKCVLDMQKQVLLAGEKPVPLTFPTPQQMLSICHVTFNYYTSFLGEAAAGSSFG